MNKTIWQQAAGDKDRNYAKICLDWDVILAGPGYAGRWPDCKAKMAEDGWSARKITAIGRLAEEMSDGDTVVLRSGTNQVSGVGMVIGDYKYLDIFEDVDGWDLQHVRRVKWLWKGAEKAREFPTHTLKLGDTTQKLHREKSKEVLEWIGRLNLNFSEITASDLQPLPLKEDERVNFNDVSEYLFDAGVSSTSIETLNTEIGELTRIAKWYQKFADPSESETRSYLVVPLLRALGWTPQKMAIEWNKVDVALFNTLPREDDNLSVVVEVKKKGLSCLTAVLQASDYAERGKNCHRLIVTDGLRYGVYIKEDSDFKLYAYFNITNLKASYAIYKCWGVNRGLQAMTPEWREHEQKSTQFWYQA